MARKSRRLNRPSIRLAWCCGTLLLSALLITGCGPSASREQLGHIITNAADLPGADGVDIPGEPSAAQADGAKEPSPTDSSTPAEPAKN